MFVLGAQEAQNQTVTDDCFLRPTQKLRVNGSFRGGAKERWDDQGRGKTEGSLLLSHRIRKQRGTGQTCCIREAVSGAGQGTGAP